MFSYRIGGVDYVNVNTTIIFPADSVNGNQVCFDVSIIDDLAFEKDEYFSLHIVSAEDNVIIHIEYISFHIHDDDCEHACTNVKLNSSQYLK